VILRSYGRTSGCMRCTDRSVSLALSPPTTSGFDPKRLSVQLPLSNYHSEKQTFHGNASHQRSTKRVAVWRSDCMRLCVPGMGMILWGASPLYIIWKEVTLASSKSTSRGQGRKGDLTSERSLRANLRADEQKLYQAEPQGESAQHDEAQPDHWGMVNAAVVRGKIMFLPGEVCQPKRLNGRGGTEPAKVRVNMAEVSRRREPGIYSGERSEGSVIARWP
jgi:hypothetical protein